MLSLFNPIELPLLAKVDAKEYRISVKENRKTVFKTIIAKNLIDGAKKARKMGADSIRRKATANKEYERYPL